jgi:hypothetical protein
VVDITISRFKSLDPMWEGASCTCIASKMALNSGKSNVAVRDNGGKRLCSCVR